MKMDHNPVCDVCNKKRHKSGGVNHVKCSKIRQARNSAKWKK